MRKTCFYTIYDAANEQYASMLRNSLKKFHPDIPLIEFTDKEINASGVARPDIFYMAAPFYAEKLMTEGYEQIIKLDVDQIITGSLGILLTEPHDVAVVYNWNRIDPVQYGTVGVWDINPQHYYNNGFVSLRSREFVDHWLMLCKRSNIANYRYREQAVLNIICQYGNYNVYILDRVNDWYGIHSKGEWPKCIMKEDIMILPKGEDGYPEEEKTIHAIHWG